MNKIVEVETKAKNIENEQLNEEMMDNILKVHACPCGKADCEFASDFFAPDAEQEENVDTPYHSTCRYTMIDRDGDTVSTSES